MLTSERYTFVHVLIFDISGKTHINWQPSPTHMILLFVLNFSVNILLQETIYLNYFLNIGLEETISINTHLLLWGSEIIYYKIAVNERHNTL